MVKFVLPPPEAAFFCFSYDDDLFPKTLWWCPPRPRFYLIGFFVDDDERATRESCYLPTNGPVLAYLIYLSKKETRPSPRPPRFCYSFYSSLAFL